MARTETETRPSEARQRLLATASRIFYAEGIHSVGVDRIIAEAKVTRATFYRHFPGKEDLVLAYLQSADQAIRHQITTAVVPGASAGDTVRAIAAAIADGIRTPGFRGCAFLNAVAEYPDPAHPVHQAVLAHRRWFLDTVNTLMAELQAARAEPAAQHFVMLRDGAMAAGCLFDPDAICETFLRGVDGLVRIHGTPAG
ncbi:TetR/AcrR family transcriptional regulator [Actinoplanes xinjiangensis]|uniref:TetR family transcriptional regulator n=1 Tax=Actinoplanes xinjiangensis TaxID=512350 RepID=A0A316FH30_9ACTN|nr:TetR/AcrR family transcriptional regulator [Actinoplanes xinjiangensis]PWK48228.1 TetR family transcriptional regulator [Actinoplanes xinjiangensis]GIF39017.1 TetR family transcriptional regulator [Actinoplanes xinjiangensis]